MARFGPHRFQPGQRPPSWGWITLARDRCNARVRTFITSSKTVGHRRTDQVHRANPLIDSATKTPRLLSSPMKPPKSSETATPHAPSTNSAGQPLRKPAAPPSPGSSRRGKRILLVDDDPTVRDSLSDVLVSEGYLVIPAENGQEALDLVTRFPVDLALLDLNMPVKNGWDTFERLTAEHPLVPIIIATARPNQLFTALNAGAGALLEKPMDIPALLRTMEKLLAETAEQRLARLAGKETEFHYKPATASRVNHPATQ